MRLYAFLILAAYASAAAVPALDVKDLEKKLAAVAQQAQKDVVLPVPENTSSDQELLDQANAVNEVENNLKRVKITDIPVKVVVEDVKPVIKADIEKDEPAKTDEVEIKRVEVDLNNPGAPQRQEHETQNPEYYEQPIPSNVKKLVVDAQAVLKQGFEGINQGLRQNWFTDNQQIASIQQGMQDLQDNFFGQLNKLNQTLQGLVGGSQSVAPVAQKDGIVKVQDGLRTLENNFQNGLRTLNDGVQTIASVRAEGDGGSTTGTTGGTTGSTDGSTGSSNPFLTLLQTLQATLTQGFGNVTAAIQNTFPGTGNSSLPNPSNFISGLGSGIQNIIGGSQSTAGNSSGTQSDEGVTTSRPGLAIWQGIQNSIQNILNPGQNQAQSSQASQPSQPGPIVQAIQNSPIVQGVVNLIQPNRPGAQQPAAATEKPAEASQEGSNEVPAATANEVKPEQSSDEKKPENTDGPIKKIIQNNPIVKGISGAVQKIQALSNPEKPRDTLEGERPEGDVKGGFIPIGVYGHGGGGSGDNSDVNLSVVPVKTEQEDKKEPEEPKKEVEVKEEKKEETQPEPEATENKTE